MTRRVNRKECWAEGTETQPRRDCLATPVFQDGKNFHKNDPMDLVSMPLCVYFVVENVRTPLLAYFFFDPRSLSCLPRFVPPLRLRPTPFRRTGSYSTAEDGPSTAVPETQMGSGRTSWAFLT